jgi:two-component system, cell cycle response regulator
MGRGRIVSWDDITHVKAPPEDVVKLGPARDQAYLVVLAGSSMGEMFKLTRQRMVVGRSATADIRMLDDGVSREHCEVLLENGKVVVHDLGSTNGTFCRGARVDRQELADGDKILVGTGTVLKFTYHDSMDEVFQRQMFESVLRDDLTKAFNRKYFLDRVESEYAYAVRHDAPASLVAIDIDHFKAVNDTHGHAAGDHVLAELAAAVHATIRVEDVFARIGGEEFSVLCRGADLMQGKIVGERIRYAVEHRTFVHENNAIPLTVSVGVVSVPTQSVRDANEFMAAADQMLYEAKRAGRNRVVLWKR